MTPNDQSPHLTPEPEPSQGGRRRLAGASRAARRAVAPFSHAGYPRLAAAMLAVVLAQGTWALTIVFQVMAQGGSPVELSVVSATGAVGVVMFALIGGVVADRFPPHLVLRAVMISSTLVTAVTAILSATGMLSVGLLAAASFLVFAGVGIFYPSYSASLPRLLPAEALLAANGLEGSARPLLQTAAGPALAGLLAAALSPTAGFAMVALCYAVAVAIILRLRVPELVPDPVTGQLPQLPSADPLVTGAQAHRQDGDDEPVTLFPPDPAAAPSGGLRSMLADMMDGVSYVRRTAWLMGTLIFAVITVFCFIGPLEVLLPFVVRDAFGGGAAEVGLLLGVTGAASAVGALVISGMPLPRRYLTWIMVAWGFGTLPLLFVGFTESWVVLVAIMIVVGATDGIGQVLWGTLLQRRVPARMLGRVSSLDFFVSLLLMPVSMAVVGPLSTVVPVEAIFAAAAIVPAVMAVVVWIAFRMARDEAAHPLKD